MMEAKRSCKLEKSDFGLYNVRITGEQGEVITDVRSVTFAKAVCVIEDYMHTSSVRRAEGE
jgi:hypothetical protein